MLNYIMKRNAYSNKISYFRRMIENWYKKNSRNFPWRKKTYSKYKILISEILLRRTRAEMVSDYIGKFFTKYPSWKALSMASRKELKNDLKPLGLYNLRSDSLFSLARKIKNGKLPVSRKELENLPGIGQYTASTVLSICYNKPEPFLDKNMSRILERFFGPRKLADMRFDPYLQELSRKILPLSKTKEFNWAILDYASIICRPRNPQCNICIIPKYCLFMKNNLSKYKKGENREHQR